MLHSLLVKKKCLLLIKEVFATLALLFFPNTKYCTPHKYGGLERGYYLTTVSITVIITVSITVTTVTIP